ncbi:hypothetical protein ACG7TL_002624 [Trametes sanguinea]
MTSSESSQTPPKEPHAEASHSRSPTITYHHKHLSPLRPDDLISSIAGGAHYAGALRDDEEEPPLHQKAWRRRSMSRNADDPNVEAAFKDVIEDLQQVGSSL